MKKLSLTLLFSLLALPVLAQTAAAPNAAPSITPLSDVQKTQIEQVMKDLLNREPELVMQAAQRFQQREQEKQQNAAAVNIKTNRDKLFNDKNSPVEGAKDADVSIVEFFDYNCGFCKRAHEATEQVRAADKKVRFIYKQYPILGPNSMVAARHAIAADMQGKFKEFHHALLTNKGTNDEAAMQRIAGELKLNWDKLKADAASPAVQQRIDADLALGREIGVQGTPGFVIGDKLYPGAMPAEQFQQLIAEQRSAAKAN